MLPRQRRHCSRGHSGPLAGGGRPLKSAIAHGWDTTTHTTTLGVEALRRNKEQRALTRSPDRLQALRGPIHLSDSETASEA
eukprot:1632922-Alexandrium_andersonii.AAC.1